MKISVVLGTAREGRQSEKVAKVVSTACEKRDRFECTYVDVRDHLETFATTRFGKEDERPHAWHDIACETDGFIFVLPEYNHGYPGEWKLLMDSLYKKEYIHKVAAIVGVSSGGFGGVRGAEHATLSLAARGMYVMKDVLSFAKVESLFDEEGNLNSEEQNERLETFLDTFEETVGKYR